MIFHAANFDGLHIVLPGDPAEEWPEPFAQFRFDERTAFLGAEYAMEMGTDVGHGVYSAVPAGLWQYQTIIPGIKMPGYCRRVALRRPKLVVRIISEAAAGVNC